MSAVVTTFVFHLRFGQRVNHFSQNYLSFKRARILTALIYLAVTIRVTLWLDAKERLDINKLVSGSETNG